MCHNESYSYKLKDIGLFNCSKDVIYLNKILGEGADGKIVKCKIRGQEIALKRARTNKYSNSNKENINNCQENSNNINILLQEREQIATEIHYLRQVRYHPLFVQCLGICDGIKHTCIAMEVMECSLSDYIKRRLHVKRPLNLKEIIYILKQVCKAMIYLHNDLNIAHGDVASRNILIEKRKNNTEKRKNINIKISDFGRILLPENEPDIFYKKNKDNSKDNNKANNNNNNNNNNIMARENKNPMEINKNNLEIKQNEKENNDTKTELINSDICSDKSKDNKKLKNTNFSFYKNSDVGMFAREVLYRLLVNDKFPEKYLKKCSLTGRLQCSEVTQVPDGMEDKLGDYKYLFYSCNKFAVRPNFTEILENIEKPLYFKEYVHKMFPLEPLSIKTNMSIYTPIKAKFNNNNNNKNNNKVNHAYTFDVKDTSTLSTRHKRKSDVYLSNNGPNHLTVSKKLCFTKTPQKSASQYILSTNKNNMIRSNNKMNMNMNINLNLNNIIPFASERTLKIIRDAESKVAQYKMKV